MTVAIEQLVRRRETNGITILFYSHDELIVQTNGMSIIFHCWFTTSRKQTFRPFTKALMYRKNITLGYIYEQAREFGVYNITDNYGKGKRLLERIDKELPSKGEARNR